MMHLSYYNINTPCTTIADPTKGATSERWGEWVGVIGQNIIVLPRPN